MKKVEAFLSLTEEQEIISAIRTAEKTTSGEIRIHLETYCDVDVMLRAKEVFHFLKMDTTKLANGVLLYIATDSQKFAIYGGAGINNIVPNDFWKSTKDSIQQEFRKGNFKQGIISGIHLAGQQLQAYFPWDDTDQNELPDLISKS